MPNNLTGSAIAGSLGGFNAHTTNIVSAVFIAIGQDPAQNIKSSHCITLMVSIPEKNSTFLLPCPPLRRRFEKHIYIPLPNFESGKELIKINLKTAEVKSLLCVQKNETELKCEANKIFRLEPKFENQEIPEDETFKEGENKVYRSKIQLFN